MNARLGELPPRERVLCEGGWRAAHAFDTSLPGWLVLAPLRHVVALHELTREEASSLGGLLVRLSTALRDTVNCEKTYTMLFAEAAGFQHLHIHVVPRMPSFTADQVGPRVFTFLGRPVGERVEVAAQDDLAGRISAALDPR
jgi:diadenosine tetraphosphate (Ap4A) HIT family hydrolase